MPDPLARLVSGGWARDYRLLPRVAAQAGDIDDLLHGVGTRPAREDPPAAAATG